MIHLYIFFSLKYGALKKRKKFLCLKTTKTNNILLQFVYIVDILHFGSENPYISK